MPAAKRSAASAEKKEAAAARPLQHPPLALLQTPPPIGSSEGGSSSHRSPITYIVGPIDFGFGELAVEDHAELTVPRLCLRSNKKPMDDDGIVKLCAALDAAFALERPMTILWDVRSVLIPSRKQVNIGLEWIGANSHLLDTYLQGIAIVLSSLVIRGIANFVLSVCQPPQPNGCFADDAEAFAFARDKCTEVRVWVGKGKLRKMKREEAAAARAAAAAEGEDPTTPSGESSPETPSRTPPSGKLFGRASSSGGKLFGGRQSKRQDSASLSSSTFTFTPESSPQRTAPAPAAAAP